MAVQSYSIEIQSVNLYKFRAMSAALAAVPDKITSLDIIPQVQEITIYESIFMPIIRVELAVVDYINLFTNWPLLGEELIVINYKNVGDATTRQWFLAIDEVTDITTDDKNRAISYIIKTSSIESLANKWGTIMQSYKGTPTQIAKKIFEEHIIGNTVKFFPSYVSPNIFAEDNQTIPMTLLVPNMSPIAAIDMVNMFAVSEVSNKYSSLFYQNNDGFNIKTIQTMIQSTNARRHAEANKYIYYPNEISETTSSMHNKERIVSNLFNNRRLSTTEKLTTGYFNNNLFEINLAQKAIHTTKHNIDDANLMYSHHFNSIEFENWAKSNDDGDEAANRTRYVLTTRPENDSDFPVYRTRDKWGKDLSSLVALNQIDYTAVIPGTNRFVAGDLFYLEIPAFQGFQSMKEDDQLSGLFLITEVKHIVRINGFQTTVLRLNKDSFQSDINRGSKYV